MDDGKEIIVVEDDPSMNHTLDRLLEAAGWRPRVFDSTEALLSSGSAKEVACFIFDIPASYFPKPFDGRSLIKAIAHAVALFVAIAFIGQSWIG
jgi:DNA-binding NtrC family response regulator